MRRVYFFLIILTVSFLLISCKECTPTSPTTTTTATTSTTSTTTTTSTTVETKPVVIRETGEGYDTIGEAITAASAGQHIDVSAGTYAEHLLIEKQLYLTGKDRNTTIIDGEGSGNVVEFEAGADGSDIRGFTVKNGGLGIDGATGGFDLITIGRNVVKENDYGILANVHDVTSVLIKNNNNNGIEVGGTPFPIISECDIQGNGIGLYSLGTYPSVLHCRIENNNLYGICVDIMSGPDLGSGASGSPGHNIIRGNGNWDLYSQIPEVIKAENNYWGYTTAAEIDDHIYDNDENAAYGAVDFEPFLTSPPTASLMMKPRLLSASSLFADFFRSLFRADLPASAIYLSPSFEHKINLTRFDLLRAKYRPLADELYYPPLMLRASR
jgi:hypothetical protein